MRNKHVRPMEVKNIKVKLEDGSVIRGKINLRSEYVQGAGDNYCHDYSADAGVFYNRVSDLVAKGRNSFIAIFDITGEGFENGGPLIINKSKILWIFPED